MYTTIIHEVRKAFGLTMNEYAVADTIYCLSRKRVCNASKEYIGELLDLSKQTIHTILNKLEAEGIINRKGQNCETTERWDAAIIVNKTGIGSKESLPQQSRNFTPKVKKLYSNSKESLPYIKTNNKKDINIDISNTPTAAIGKPLPIIIDLCDKINYMPRDKAVFAREMKAAKEFLALTDDMVKHYGGDDVIGTITWMIGQAQKMKAAGHWYLKNKPIKPSTLRYCFDELTTMIVDEKKRREDSEKFMAENAKLKVREVQG